MRKRLLSIVLSVAMVVSLAPVFGGTVNAVTRSYYGEVNNCDEDWNTVFFEGVPVLASDFVLYPDGDDAEPVYSEYFTIKILDDQANDVTAAAAKGELQEGVYEVTFAADMDVDDNPIINSLINSCSLYIYAEDSIEAYDVAIYDGTACYSIEIENAQDATLQEIYDSIKDDVYLGALAKVGEDPDDVEWKVLPHDKAFLNGKIYKDDGGVLLPCDMDEYPQGGDTDYYVCITDGNGLERYVGLNMDVTEPYVLWFNGVEYTESGYVQCDDGDDCQAYWDAECGTLELDNCTITKTSTVDGVTAGIIVKGGDYVDICCVGENRIENGSNGIFADGTEVEIAEYGDTEFTIDCPNGSGIISKDGGVALSTNVNISAGKYAVDMDDSALVNYYGVVDLKGGIAAINGNGNSLFFFNGGEVKAYGGNVALQGIDYFYNTGSGLVKMDIGSSASKIDKTVSGSDVKEAVYNNSSKFARIYEEAKNVRYAGSNRYETALMVADGIKEINDIDEFDCIVVAYGGNYADALAGGYLAYYNDAPIILVDGKHEQMTADYIKDNLAEGGKVYILGGTGAVSAAFEKKVRNLPGEYDVTRLGGASRYETNMMILEEAGVEGSELLVCSGTGYADSLSASAAYRPILLVGKSLTAAQKQFIKSNKFENATIIGGTGAVNASVEKEVKSLVGADKVERLAGANRYETSLKVATYLVGPSDVAVFTYAQNFPDGLSGGVLAMNVGGPLILTENKDAAIASAKKYTTASGTTSCYILGGPKLISDSAVDRMMNRSGMNAKTLMQKAEKMN